MKYRITPTAVEELVSLIEFIRAESERGARQLLDDYEAALESICQFPNAWPIFEYEDLSGKRVLRKRFFGAGGRFLILYQVMNDVVVVQLVCYSVRDISRLEFPES